MGATEARGKETGVYGRTADRVVEMDVGLTDGGDLNTSATEGSGSDVHAVLATETDEMAVFFQS